MKNGNRPKLNTYDLLSYLPFLVRNFPVKQNLSTCILQTLFGPDSV